MDKLFILSVWRLSYTDKMNQVMEENTFIYLNPNAILTTVYSDFNK